eukprot:jgi/Picsp_1/6399/NSC_03747-R1_hypothetical protein CHLNCDRAFT_57767 [Chlorella variabilis]
MNETNYGARKAGAAKGGRWEIEGVIENAHAPKKRKMDDVAEDGGNASAMPPGKQMLQQQSSSMRETQITPPSNLVGVRGGTYPAKNNAPVVDSYLLKLLRQSPGASTQGSKQTASTGFRVPDPVARKTKKVVKNTSGKQSGKGMQGSNSDKTLLGAKPEEWSYADTQDAMGKEATEVFRNSLMHHQKMYIEQLYDLHRAIAVQNLLIRHAPDLKKIVHETNKHMASKRQAQKGGLGFETSTSLHKGLHPDSQFAALPPSKDVTEGSGEDLTGSGDDVAGSGSGGNGGSGGGSTSPQYNTGNAQVGARGPGIMNRAPSGASNAPILTWQSVPPGVAPPGAWANGMNIPDRSGQLAQYGPIYGPDPMMWWYQDYYNRIGGFPANDPNASIQQQQRQNKSTNGQSPFKWWQDPKAVFGAPADAAEVLAKEKTVQGRAIIASGGEAESAPPSKPINTPGQTAVKEKRRIVQPANPRRRKRKPADPVEEASSGTTGPAHHADSADGLLARSPRSGDANVAKLLLSFSANPDQTHGCLGSDDK